MRGLPAYDYLPWNRKLLLRRVALGLSQQQVADALSVDRASLSRVEHDRQYYSQELRRRLEQFYTVQEAG